MNFQNLVKMMIFQILAKTFQSKKFMKVKLKFRCHLNQILAKSSQNWGFFLFSVKSFLNYFLFWIKFWHKFSQNQEKNPFFQSIFKFWKKWFFKIQQNLMIFQNFMMFQFFQILPKWEFLKILQIWFFKIKILKGLRQ